MYGLSLVTPPAEEPVTLAELKAWCRVDGDEDDAVIAALGRAARQYVEKRTGRQLVTAAWLLTLDGFPWPGGWEYLSAPAVFPDPHTIRLPKSPLRSVASVEYYDLGNTLRTLATTVYDVDAVADPGKIALAMNQVWPVTRLKPGAVRVTFSAGYGAASEAPDDLKTAIKMLAARMLENRGEGAEVAADAVPMAVNALCDLNWNGEREYGF